jgi:two-component system, OmpR family, sensor histidine kinase MtrB
VARSPWSPRRLTVVVVLVAVTVGAVLAIGVYVLVRDARLRDSLERARRETVFDLRLAETLFADSTNLQQAVESYEDRGIHAVLIADGRSFRSDPAVAVRIPSGLRAIVADGGLGYERLGVRGAPTLVVGGPTPDRRAELYLLFSEAGIHQDLSQLGIALLVGWLAIVVIAFAFARAAASRIGTLAAADAWSRRFTSDVSHELRTPVAALVSEAAVLEEQMGLMPPEARRAAELLVGDVARLRRLVEDLTNLAALDAHREEVREEPFDLAALVTGAVRSRRWDGRVRTVNEPVQVVSDRSRVDRIVANLIANALEHGGGEVTVWVGVDEEGPFVEVSDRGSGISVEHLPHVFDRFYRADAARSGPGSGLGLAIARENARLLGGDIVVWSEPGAGSRFTLRLPGVGSVAEPLRERGSPVADEPDHEARPEHEGGAP